MADNMERELSWDDEITKDSSDFILLPEGDYDFVVESYERARHPGSAKLPACNKAVLKLRIETEEGVAFINHNLFLHSITEGMLSAFFSAIGQKEKDKPLKMNWNMVPGSTGRAKVGIHTYEKDGEERKANDIKRFYPKEARKFKAGEF